MPRCAVGDAWNSAVHLAWTRGDNRSDGTALYRCRSGAAADARLRARGVERGCAVAVVAAQDRYVVSQGNIVGPDIGPSGGFAILSLNAGWRPLARWPTGHGRRRATCSTRDYAEHLSRAGAMVSGFTQTARVQRAGAYPVVQGERRAAAEDFAVSEQNMSRSQSIVRHPAPTASGRRSSPRCSTLRPLLPGCTVNNRIGHKVPGRLAGRDPTSTRSRATATGASDRRRASW